MNDATERVNCNGCTVCCHREMIILVTGDNPNDYPGVITVDAPNPYTDEPTTKMLPHRADGACIFLGMHGCTIYDKRPTMCRVFSCVGYVRRARAEKSESAIRKAIKRGEIDREIWDAGIKRAP